MIDRVYKTVQSISNNELRGNVSPEEFNLKLHKVVLSIYDEYFSEIARLVNRENRGLSGSGLENIPDRLREKIDHYRSYGLLKKTGQFYIIPGDVRHLESVLVAGIEVESTKDLQEFKAISRLSYTEPTSSNPIMLRIGNSLQISPSTIESDVEIYYLRNPYMGKWTYQIISDTPIFNSSASDYKDIDIHPSEENKVIIRVLELFGINLKESELIEYGLAEKNADFEKDNAV